MQNISDKLIDSQGSTATYSSGRDSRLFYVNVNGQIKKYLIDGEGGGEIYEETGDTSLLVMESNKFVRYLEPLSVIDLRLTKEIKNSTIVFSVADSLDLYIDTYGMLINKPFEFEADQIYILTVNNGVIIWNILQETE